MVTSRNLLDDVFICPEESNFYSYCLENLVLERCHKSEIILEFGSGDGTPVINALMRRKFNGLICGYELNSSAWKMAKYHIKEKGLDNYTIHNASFFDAPKPIAQYLISNPPYLPALDSNLYQPLLHGGRDGASIAKRLLQLGCENVMLLVSSYSNPIGLINFALSEGYYVDNFLISPLNFGYYSSEPKVKNRIVDLRAKNKAFYTENVYLLAGVLFKQQHSGMVDISNELARLITSL